MCYLLRVQQYPVNTIYSNILFTFPIGQIYLVGATIWSSLISLYRVLFITSKSRSGKWFKSKKFLVLLLGLGIALNLLFSFLLAFYDNERGNQKFCTHFTSKDLQMLQSLKVNFNRLLKIYHNKIN